MLGWIIVISIAIIAYVGTNHMRFIRKFYLSFKLGGPPALPIIGNGLLFLNKPSEDVFQAIRELVTTYGDVFRIWIGPELNVIVQSPKDVEIILSSPKYIDKSNEYNFLKPWLNEGLLLSKGKKWFERRKIITPAFHFKILEEYVEIFDRLGNVFVNKILSKYSTKDEVEIYPLAILYALDVMCETAMGVSIDALSKPNSPYVQAVKEIVYILHLRMFDFMLRHPFFFQFSNLAKRQSIALKVLHDFTDKIIFRRRQQLLNQGINNNSLDENEADFVDIGIKKKQAFLDTLLQSSVDDQPLTDMEIREEVDTFMFEGHDTTTSGITFCLYCIANNPNVQQRCFEEIREVFADKDEPASMQHLNKLHYLELVVKETLRMFPSVPLIGRTSNEDIELTNNRTLPAGCNMIVPVYFMGHNSDLFPDAETFNPERSFKSSINDSVNHFAYIPFSAGPRNCIGQRFAMMEMKSIVSKILRYYVLKLTESSQVYPTLTSELILRPKNEIKFYLEPRVY